MVRLVSRYALLRLRLARARVRGSCLLPEGLGLVYVDGLHTYEGVRRDIADWLPFVEPDGLVVFDDYANPDWPGVARAVDEVAERGELSQPRRLYGLAIARRLSE